MTRDTNKATQPPQDFLKLAGTAASPAAPSVRRRTKRARRRSASRSRLQSDRMQDYRGIPAALILEKHTLPNSNVSRPAAQPAAEN